LDLGRIYSFSNRLPGEHLSHADRFCRETNWAGLSTDSGGWAWTQSGELWLLTGASPDPEVTCCNRQLIATTSFPVI